MTGETIHDLLKPLIGKSGTIFLVVSRSGQIGFTTDHNKKLTGVEVREDGLVRLVRDYLNQEEKKRVLETIQE